MRLATSCLPLKYENRAEQASRANGVAAPRHGSSLNVRQKIMILRFVFALAVLLVAGCASIPKTGVGIYSAPNGEFIMLKKDGALFWSPPSKTRDELQFVGIVSDPRRITSGVALVVASSSPYLYSRVRSSPSFDRIEIDWGSDLRGTKVTRATEFKK
jgi:hypothetical protein